MSGSTLVQDIETSRRTDRITSYRQFLDEKSPEAAEAANDFYELIDSIEKTDFSHRLSECRSRAWFMRNSETGQVRVAAKQCRLRWCYHCSEARQQFITQAVTTWWTEAKRPKLLTLTLSHTKEPLTAQIDHLYKSFVKLRNRKFFKQRVGGGVWFFQITYNDKRQEWHPHLHILLDAMFLDQVELKHLWLKITKTSSIVHIRMVHDPEKTLAHNARYAARPSALLKIPQALWPDLFEAFNGRKICGTFGRAKVISLRPVKPENAEQWQSIGGFKTVLHQQNTDPNAKAIWRAWLTGTELEPDINMNETEDFIDGIESNKPPPTEFEVEPLLESIRETPW